MIESREQEEPDRLFGLLAAVGNSEAKALTLVVMRDGQIFTRGDLGRAVMVRQAAGRRWAINRSLPFSYCRNSLSPIGLVTREAINPDFSTYGYQITDYGRTTGIPLAGALLKWSYDHPSFSLYWMFGQTNSKFPQTEEPADKKRAPKTRCKIFRQLLTNPADRIRTVDLAQRIGEKEGLVSGHLDSLFRNNVISYTTIERGQQFVFFRWNSQAPPEQPEPYKGYPTLSSRVYEVLRTHPDQDLSIGEILGQLRLASRIKETILRHEISVICSNLVRQGYVNRQKFGGSVQSEIVISPEQRVAVSSLIDLLDRFHDQNQRVIEEGRRFADTVLVSPELFSDLMLKAQQASPHANQWDIDETDTDIISLVQQFPNCTLGQIAQTLKEHKLDKNTIMAYLHELVRKRKLAAEKTKRGMVYTVVVQ